MNNEDLLEAIKTSNEVYCFDDDFISMSLLYRVYVYEREQQIYINFNDKRYELFLSNVSHVDMYDV